MKLGAIVLQYRQWPETREVIERLLAGSRRPEFVVVVDNASGDGSVDAIREQFGIEVIEAAKNLGYAGGMNLGVSEALRRGMDAILLLTHDCLLATDALAILVARLEAQPQVGLVGPLTGYAHAPDRVFTAGCRIDRRSWEMVLDQDPPLLAQWRARSPEVAEWVAGSCLLVRADALRATGPMDENYFLYFEEVDFQLRLRRLGWQIECVPTAVVWQEPGLIPLDLWVRSRLRFLLRNAPHRVVVREFVRQGHLALSEASKGEIGRALARLRGVLLFVRRRWGPIEVEHAIHLRR